jgi:Glycosyl transferase family 2
MDSPNEREPIVAIPARNEAERLPNLLKALSAQSWSKANHAPLRVVVVLNNCSDPSADVIRTIALEHPSLSVDVVEVNFEPAKAHVGSARRLAMDRALDIADGGAVILSTDADAVPNSNWVEANLYEVERGADLVGGYIVGDPVEEALLGPGFIRRASRHLRYLKLVDCLRAIVDPVSHDPWPRHNDHTGASLAVKSDIYVRVGGIPEIPCREDVAFVAKACRAGFRLRHAPKVQVTVSARLDGRATGGMADCLKAWVMAEERQLPQVVEDPILILHRLRQRCRKEPELLRGGSNPTANAYEKIEIDIAMELLEQIITSQEDLSYVV